MSSTKSFDRLVSFLLLILTDGYTCDSFLLFCLRTTSASGTE